MKQENTDNMASGHRARLRDRFCTNGLETFADYEVVELLLTYAIPRIDVKPAAKMLVRKFENLRGILHAPEEDLRQIPHIGDSAVTFLKFIRELIPIYHANELSEGGEKVPTISKLMKLFRARIGSLPNEVLEMACFDAKLKIVDGGIVRLFEGSVNSSSVDIRRIVETAISKGASSIALAHNHPSGDPTPSFEGIRFTRRLSAACKPIDLNFIEHVVVGRNQCFSFRRDGHFDSLYDESLEESRLRGRCKVAEPEDSIDDRPEGEEKAAKPKGKTKKRASGKKSAKADKSK